VEKQLGAEEECDDVSFSSDY